MTTTELTVSLFVSACVVWCGWGAYQGKAKIIYRAGLSDRQVGVFMMVVGTAFAIETLVRLVLS